MRKKKYVALLLCVLLSLCMFAVACDGYGENGQDGEENLVLEYLEESNIILWKCNWADKYTLIVYFGENTDGTVIYNESDISATENHRRLSGYFTQSGKHFVVLFAFKGSEVERKTLVIDVKINFEQQDPNDGEDPSEPDHGEGFKKDVGKLKSVYNHVAKSGEDLSIVLANQNGVKSVSGFALSQYSDWRYDQETNALKISGVYLNKFSVGARLTFDVEYNDGRDDEIKVQIVKEMPMDVVKGGLINSLIYSDNTNGVIALWELAINYDIYLGYGNEVASESSINYVKDVSIDGKKLLSSAYVCSKDSKITLTANKSLNGLSYGMHLLEIFTTRGKSEVWLNVKGANTYPINVSIDYDDSYPDIFVKWTMLRDDAEKFVVKIGDREYSSVDYPQLFDGYKFNAKDKISRGDEVRVTAYIDGKGDTSLGATLDIDISNASINGYLSYDNGSFEYLGTRYNTFIDDYDELKDLVFYSLIHYNDLRASTDSDYEKMWRIYVNPTLAVNATELDNKIRSAVEYFNEGVKDSWKVKGGYINIYEIHLKVYSTCIPDGVVRVPSVKENYFNDTHFSAVGRSSDYEGFAVNDLQDTAEVTYSEELYRALERGVRPIPKQGSQAQTVYEKAKKILRTIIDDGMNDYQKTHAIVDWLSANVTYNWDLADELSKASSSSDDYNKYYAYRELYLEGAILDGLAVCNGYAKAVSLLCGIEGIRCYKIKGASGSGSGLSPNRVYPQHAWNKVYIGGSWYVLDSTWANEKYQFEGSNQIREVLKHNTLFMTDEQSGNQRDGQHYEIYLGDYSGYFSGSPYDVFANTFFYYDGNIYDMVIDNEKELEVLLKYVASAQGKNMGRDSYLTIDVRCDNTLLKQYIATLKNNGLDVLDNFSVTTKYFASYGSMTSLVLWKK